MAVGRTYDRRGRGRGYPRQRQPAARRVRPEDVAVGLSLEEVQGLVGPMFDAQAHGTQDVYQKHWQYFLRWYGRRRAPGPEVSPNVQSGELRSGELQSGEVQSVNVQSGERQSGEPLSRKLQLAEVTTNHFRVYLKTNRENRHRSVSWLCCAVAAVRMALEYERLDHRIDWDLVSSDMRKYRTRGPKRERGVDGITRELFELIEAAAPRPMDGEWSERTMRRAAFDVALIALMRDCLLRRSEAAAVTWGDIKVEVTPGHVYGVLSIPHSKVDQAGKGDVVYVHVSTLARLHQMAKACGRDPNDPGQLVFDMSPGQMARRIKSACAHAGLMGKFSGHSPRVGMAVDLATYNTPLVGVMQAGRWRMPATVLRYIRGIAVGKGAVARYHHRLNRVAMSGPVAPKEWE